MFVDYSLGVDSQTKFKIENRLPIKLCIFPFKSIIFADGFFN
jgi:hypothetical protein